MTLAASRPAPHWEQTMNTYSIGWFAILLTSSTLFAAERTERVVTGLLQQEEREAVAQRATVLQPVLEQSPDLALARWLAGYVSVGKEWALFDQVPEQSERNDALREYRVRRGTQELKFDEHLELANWCEKHRLPDQAQAHLFAVVSEQPQRSDLWRRLGYKLVDGRWMTTKEERELEQRWQQRQRDLKRWRGRAANLAQRLSEPKPEARAIARQQLLEIDEVSALPALEAALTTSTPELALEFVNWTKGINRVETTLTLARLAIVSEADSVREHCVESLRQRPLDDYAPALLDILSTPYEAGPTLVDAPGIRPGGNSPWSSAYQPGQVVAVRQFHRETRDRIELATIRTVAVAQSAPESIFRSFRNPRSNSPGATQRIAREQNDQARNLADQTAEYERRMSAANQSIETINNRVDHVLASVTGLQQPDAAQGWWAWHQSYMATESTGPKGIVEVGETERLPVSDIRVRQMSCLPAGTPVYTELGPRPIESLRLGDRVLSKDIDSGELSYRPILKTTVRKPQPLVKLCSAQETIQATRGHHFFVSGRGWVMARDLQPGDRFHGVYGTVTLTDVVPGDTAAVYNLVVDRTNTYFVGRSLVLSHDVTPPSPTNVKVPGLAAR
jgi:hypothetical protein